MKKLLLILLCLPLITFAQQTYVPDNWFEAYLENNGMGNGVQYDDSVFTAAIDTVTYLDLSYGAGQAIGVFDLTGIEDFTNLEYLDCSYNLLTNFDLSQNTALEYLDCRHNSITSLDVSQNTALTGLDCSFNQLTTLDVSNNTALTFLSCGGNQLTNLDVSQNTALTDLWCGTNQLTSLDVSQNTSLTGLYCSFNQLTTLDVSNNTALTNLWCNNNQITYLDLTSQISFVHLYIEGNNLTSLDISHMQCPGLAEANLSNPNLFCIQVTDVFCWYQPFTSWMIDTTFQYFSANCSGTAIEEHTTNKELLRTIDILGRETKNKPLFYIYDDGTVEKRITIE